MGEMFGLPEWLFVSLWVVLGLTGFLLYANRSLRKTHERVAAQRPNPSKDDFLAAMAADCSSEVSEFLWGRALYYVEPRLTPDPDDDLFLDLKIDDEDVSIDWTREWAERRGFHESNLPAWPDEWPVTVRNFGRWLDMGPTA